MVVFDLAKPNQDVIYVPVDLTQYGQVLDAMMGVEERYEQVDALVHLAAIPAPGRVPNHTTFANNMNATWNVISAAQRAGSDQHRLSARRGLPFDTPPPYVPVDENYPPRPESTYSLVKTMEETMAAQLCRWNPELKMIGLRFSNVMGSENTHGFRAFRTTPASGSGTSGATSTRAMAPRRSDLRWSPTSPVAKSSSSPTRTP